MAHDPETVAMKAKVLTVSDGVVHGTREDRSGAALVERLTGAGYEVVDHVVTADGTTEVADTLVAMADFESGSRMRVTMRHSPRPSTRAASISEGGTASKLALKMKMQMIVDKSGSAMPR